MKKIWPLSENSKSSFSLPAEFNGKYSWGNEMYTKENKNEKIKRKKKKSNEEAKTCYAK